MKGFTDVPSVGNHIRFVAGRRPQQAAADIVLGMGTSAQKGMAFAKPVVIQGERGYWETLTPESMPQYLHHNFYGLGDGGDGAPRLAAIIGELARDRGRWPELGEFGRKGDGPPAAHCSRAAEHAANRRE
jgi:hypothetical protein